MLTFENDSQGFWLKSHITLPWPLSTVFPFFASPANLETITPPFLRFEILGPPPLEMKLGLLIDYRLKLYGIPLRWQSEITAWEPPHCFVDEQRRGPYLHWRHQHNFDEKDGQSTVTDSVCYRLLGGRIINELLVKEWLRRIFMFRRAKLLEIFGGQSHQPPESFDAAIREPRLPGQLSIQEASVRFPVLLVFLRHSGCTFCRETLAKLSTLHSSIEQSGIRLVIVSMLNEEEAVTFLSKYGLEGTWHLSDPHRHLYQAFGLTRGTLQQLAGGRVLARGLLEGALWKHGAGFSTQDNFQMPGSYLVYRGQVVWAHVPESIADEAALDVDSLCAWKPPGQED